MVETKNLKRFNLVYDHRKNICPVDEILEKSITLIVPVYGRLTYEDGAVYPIPLDEKTDSGKTIGERMLKKIGLKKYTPVDYFVTDDIVVSVDGEVFVVSKSDDIKKSPDKYATIKRCKYVHELQNVLDSIGVNAEIDANSLRND